MVNRKKHCKLRCQLSIRTEAALCAVGCFTGRVASLSFPCPMFYLQNGLNNSLTNSLTHHSSLADEFCPPRVSNGIPTLLLKLLPTAKYVLSPRILLSDFLLLLLVLLLVVVVLLLLLKCTYSEEKKTKTKGNQSEIFM